MSLASILTFPATGFSVRAWGHSGWRLRLLWPFLPLVAGGVLWFAVDQKIARERQSFEQSLNASAQSIAAGYARYLTRTIDHLDQVTLQLKYDWEQSHGRFRLDELARRGIFSSQHYADVAVVDSMGNIVTATTPIRDARIHAAKSYFRQHRMNISSALHIAGAERDPASGKPVVRFTRRLDAAGDDFDGIVVVSVYADSLSAYYDSIALGNRGLLAMVGADGEVRASRIGAQDPASGTAALAHAPRFGTPASRDGVFMNGEGWLAARWFSDGERRLAAWRTLPAYPVTIMAGLSEREQVAGLEDKWHAYRRIRLLAEAVLFALAGVLGYAAHMVDRRKTRLASVQAAYRLATEAGEEGFYMLHPIRRRNRIVDFRVLDCNERGAYLFGKAKQELLGQTLSSNYGEDDFARLRNIYCHAMTVGSYREEDQFRPLGSPTPRWVRRKVVRSAGDLAVTLRDISEAKAQQGELMRLAKTDELTGLPNRSWFIGSLASTLAAAGANGESVALLFIDLDKFKNVNDALGHAAGDLVLKEAAARLRLALRPTDHIARLGGDEFTVVLHRVGGDADILRVANRILQAMAQPFAVAEAMMDVGATIGISVYPRDGASAEALLKYADIAMYAAKGERRGTHAFYRQSLYDALTKRLNTERELADAIERDEFVLHYQPRVDAAGGTLLSLEALVRWRHPQRGMVPPMEFIPIAESTGLIARLGALVIQKACAQIAQWRADGLAVVPVSVNVSAVQFQHGDVHELLFQSLAQSDVAPGLIELELTESAMLGEHAAIADRLAAIRRLGVKIAVDDFGTGYSSLSQLQRLDMDVLKVDRVFTADLGISAESHVLFKAIVSMAHALDMKVVAEGVETELQASMLRDLGCDELQGYLISRPVEAAAIAAMLRRTAADTSGRHAAAALCLAA